MIDMSRTLNKHRNEKFVIYFFCPPRTPSCLLFCPSGNQALISRARTTLNLPCISPQNSVTCNGEYRRPVIKAQPSCHDVEVDGRIEQMV